MRSEKKITRLRGELTWARTLRQLQRQIRKYYEKFMCVQCSNVFSSSFLVPSLANSNFGDCTIQGERFLDKIFSVMWWKCSNKTVKSFREFYSHFSFILMEIMKIFEGFYEASWFKASRKFETTITEKFQEIEQIKNWKKLLSTWTDSFRVK